MPVNIIKGLFDVIEDPTIRYGFLVICSDSAAFGICENFVDFLLFHVVVKKYGSGSSFCFFVA